jgi:hypothetical protein
MVAASNWHPSRHRDSSDSPKGFLAGGSFGSFQLFGIPAAGVFLSASDFSSRTCTDAHVTLGKTMASDDKKTSPAPKNGVAEKKAVAAKKDEGQPKDKTTPDADRKAESGDKARGPKTRFESI